MDKYQVKSLLREIVRYGRIITSKHCRTRMAERRIDMVDLLNALSWGEPESIEIDKQRSHLKCEIRGADIDGDELVVQVAISEKDFAVICITAY